MRYLILLTLLACADYGDFEESDCFVGEAPQRQFNNGQAAACNDEEFEPVFDGLLGYCYERGYDSVTAEGC